MTLRVMSVFVMIAAISGCAGLSSTATPSNASTDQAELPDMEMLHRIESGFQVYDPAGLQIELKDLRAGQQVRLVTSASNLDEMKNSDNLETTQYIGTVASIAENNIVLQDASLVTQARVQHGVPIVSHVPYFSRMFKNTAVGMATQPLPHGVTVPRSKVIMAVAPDTQFVERIGVDFDFNGESRESVLSDEATFIVQGRVSQQAE